MPRLIEVFAGRTGHFAGFIVHQLICHHCQFKWQHKQPFPLMNANHNCQLSHNFTSISHDGSCSLQNENIYRKNLTYSDTLKRFSRDMTYISSCMSRIKRIWFLSPMRAAKVQASLRIRAVSPEPSLLAHTSSESRGTFRQKARSLAPLNGWACAVTICHDGMLEDTNSLDGARICFGLDL